MQDRGKDLAINEAGELIKRGELNNGAQAVASHTDEPGHLIIVSNHGFRIGTPNTVTGGVDLSSNSES